MQKPKWNAMGEREKDALVAEHIFDLMDIDVVQQPEGTKGYKCFLSGLWIVISRKDGFSRGMNYNTKEEALKAYLGDPHYVPRFTTSISDAMKVLEKFDWVRMVKDEHGSFKYLWIVEVQTYSTSEAYFGRANTLPEAICLAALRASGLTIE